MITHIYMYTWIRYIQTHLISLRCLNATNSNEWHMCKSIYFTRLVYVQWWKIHVNFYYWNNYRKNFPRYIFVFSECFFSDSHKNRRTLFLLWLLLKICRTQCTYTTDWFFVCFVNRYCFLFFFCFGNILLFIFSLSFRSCVNLISILLEQTSSEYICFDEWNYGDILRDDQVYYFNMPVI